MIKTDSTTLKVATFCARFQYAMILSVCLLMFMMVSLFSNMDSLAGSSDALVTEYFYSSLYIIFKASIIGFWLLISAELLIEWRYRWLHGDGAYSLKSERPSITFDALSAFTVISSILFSVFMFLPKTEFIEVATKVFSPSLMNFSEAQSLMSDIQMYAMLPAALCLLKMVVIAIKNAKNHSTYKV